MDARTLFGCSINHLSFSEKYNTLSEGERNRIELVAKRVWLSLLIRYELSINPQLFTFSGGYGREFSVNYIEIPSIEVYLLVTCLDTIAGNPNFQDFDQWLGSRPISLKLGKDEIIELYKQYKEEFGISKNLRNLFFNLPYDTVQWLNRNIRIRKFIDLRMQHEESSSQVLKHLFTYFYEFRRNEFTHSSSPRQTSIADDIYNPDENSRWVTPASGTYFSLYRKKPSQKWVFSFREGLDEATILRVIIHSVILQKMGFEVTSTLIKENISHYSRVHAFRLFINEVRHNANLLDSLTKIHKKGYEDFVSYVYAVGVPQLTDKSTEVAISRFKIDNNTLETGLQQMSIDYLNKIRVINQTIMNFNENNPPKLNLMDKKEKIRQFLDKLSKTDTFLSVSQWPSKVEMTNMWLVIRDPCYT